MSQGKRVVLASRPAGEPKPSDFRIEEYAVPTPGSGEVLLRTIWLSLDPYMRGRMSDGPSYAQPVPVNGVMEGGTVSEVIASNNPAFAKGDIVVSRAGWQTHAISNGQGLAKVDPKAAPISTAVGVLGMPGMTAYTGLLDIGKPQPGETVVVAAASGAVGSAVGQIAKIKGARAVGIAGGKPDAGIMERVPGPVGAGERTRCRLADMTDAKRVDEAFERDLAAGGNRREKIAYGKFAVAFALLQPDGVVARLEGEDVGGFLQPTLRREQLDLLFAQALDVEGAARNEMLEVLDLLKRAGELAGAARDRALLPARNRLAHHRRCARTGT